MPLRVQGMLRISSPVAFSRHVMTLLLRRFMPHHSESQIGPRFDDR
jgi:DNA-binding transcriptional LysR family regulator